MKTICLTLILGLLAGFVLPVAHAADTISPDAVEAKLRGVRLQSLHFREENLDAVLRFLSDASGVNFVLTDEVMASDATAAITLDLTTGMTVHQVLQVLAKLHSLHFYVQDGMVIATTDAGDFIEPELRVYNVQSLQFVPTHFTGPDLTLSSLNEGPRWGEHEICPYWDPQEPLKADELAALLKQFCGGASWDDNDGKVSIEVKGGMLFVLQTPAVHDQIARLLQLLEGAM